MLVGVSESFIGGDVSFIVPSVWCSCVWKNPTASGGRHFLDHRAGSPRHEVYHLLPAHSTNPPYPSRLLNQKRVHTIPLFFASNFWIQNARIVQQIFALHYRKKIANVS